MSKYLVVLPILAALTHLAGYVLYNVQAKLGSSEPNPVSWFLWAFLATLNGLTFTAMNDPIAALQFLAGSIGCITTFLYVLFIGKFRLPKPMEWAMFIVGVLAIVIWKVSSPEIANIVLAIAIAWSFIPTIIGVWKDPRKELATAWWYWTTAFAMTAVYIAVTKGWWTPSLIMPVLLLLCHGIVPFLASNKRKESWLREKKSRLCFLGSEISHLEEMIFGPWVELEKEFGYRALLDSRRAEHVELRRLLGMW